MSFFDDLKMKKDKLGNIKITYNKKPFVTVNVDRVFDIISDYGTKKFIRKVSKIITHEVASTEIMQQAIKLEIIYTREKKKFYGKQKIKEISKTSKEFDCLVKAVSLIDDLDITLELFIEAQIDGLSFTNTFPTPSQLITPNSEKRVLDYTSKERKDKLSFYKADYEKGSARFKEIYKDYKGNLELEMEEVDFLLSCFSKNYSTTPKGLRKYKEELGDK